VAHELNNPLDGIFRFVRLALRQMDDEPAQARAHLEESERGLLRMSNILTQLLAFSRGHLESGRPVSLSQTIRNVVALYEERARSANIDLRLDLPVDLPACPSAELCEVFSNVVKNALDAVGQEGMLEIRAVCEDGRVRVTISDDGPGVPQELQDKIFEPFVTTKQGSGGCGLGLAACRDSLSRIGGEIRLCPAEKGATFEIVVPVD